MTDSNPNSSKRSPLSKWLMRLIVAALAVGAVAAVRQIALSRNEQVFAENLRRIDAKRN